VRTHLDISNLHVSVEDTPILKGLSLRVRGGEVHAIMGPNGSGKSTLAFTLMGHPRYEVTDGSVVLDDQDILSLTPDERSKAGLFLAFQYPQEVPGVSVASFLRAACNARRTPEQELTLMQFTRRLQEKMTYLEMDAAFANRYLNEGFSGGEKKRNEILQMAMLEPKIAVLDETDSGLDIDALRVVAGGVNQLLTPQLGIIVITHYQRILEYLKPDFVHVLMDGRIVRSGGPDLADELEQRGYDWIREGIAN
jgi:Fe-S cluster assembly ATP-binding protein